MVEPQPLNSIASAIGLGDHEHVALVGGGGKTTLLHAFGEQLSGSIVLTSTTKMAPQQHGGHRVLLAPTTTEVTEAAASAPVVVWRAIGDGKALGVAAASCDEWFGEVDYVIVEADGSRRRPFKAPAEHEPVVGRTITTMVSVIGADALGRVIADQCHRPLRVAALAGCQPYERLSPAGAAAVLTHELGARKTLPPDARLVIAVTKVEDRNAALVNELLDALAARSPATVAVPISFEPI